MLDVYGDILTIGETCEILMIGKNRCYNLLRNGSIKGFRIGSTWKIPRESVINFIRESSSQYTESTKRN